MITKSTAYKIWWAGRYLERIENTARMGLIALECGKDVNELPKVLGINKDVFTYLKDNLDVLREDLRSFGDEAVINSVATLEGAIYAKNNDLKEYFKGVLQAALFLGSIIEDKIGPTITTFYPRKQEEIKTQ
ncbi:alpha-E domain-containing protein [Stygiolobus caldivivus]|uniref:alpha-E domain-containing protein n=1 Tax=Stygiolobus caldivivus TaxID=2824673 RepID=UPI001C85E3C8|nr:alpha-E domain-containing protein [Stygiolobus caldivivus]